MEKPNEIATTVGYYYVYDPGYLEKKCIEKLSDVVQEYLDTIESDDGLRELKKQIEELNKKYHYNNYSGGVNDNC